MLNIIIRYSNVTADILLFEKTNLPAQINEDIFKLYMLIFAKRGGSCHKSHNYIACST